MVFVYFARSSDGLEAAAAIVSWRQKARCTGLLAAGFAKKTVCEA
jgi:hypothetical protein